MTSYGGISVPVKVKGIKRLVKLVDLLVNSHLEMRSAMTEAVDSIRADIANAKEGWDAYVSTTEAAQADSVRRFEELQTRLDGVLADQDTAIQTAVSEAVAEANTANNDALSGLVSEARSLADAIPDAGAPAEPTPEEPAPPVDPTPPAEPTPDQPTPDVPTEEDPGDVPPAPNQV